MHLNTKSIEIRPKSIMWALGLITGLLVLAHVAVEFMRLALGHGRLNNLYRLFHLGLESNIPTYFSALLLLISALLLAAIAETKRSIHDPFRVHWRILSIGFFYLSLDEAAQIHEMIGVQTREILNAYVAEKLLVRAWVIPAAVLAMMVGMLYAKFLLHLPAKPRLMMLVAGTLYIAAAMGLEMTAANYETRQLLFVLVTLEESLEMAAIILFIYGLLNYVNYLGGLRVDIGAEKESPWAATHKTPVPCRQVRS